MQFYMFARLTVTQKLLVNLWFHNCSANFRVKHYLTILLIRLRL